MKAKTLALFVAALMILSVATACSKGPDTSVILDSPTDTEEATATATPKPSATPTATPEATASPSDLLPDDYVVELPSGDAPVDIDLPKSFKDMGKDSDVIIRGEFVKKLDEQYNAIRSMDDESQPDPGILYAQDMYEFVVTEIYKEAEKGEFKVGDTIVINIDFSDNFSDARKPAVKAKDYLEMNLKEDTVLFLIRETLNPKQTVYQTQAAVYCFTVKDGKLYPRHADQKVVDKWNKDAGAKDGVPIGNMKSDLGVK